MLSEECSREQTPIDIPSASTENTLNVLSKEQQERTGSIWAKLAQFSKITLFRQQNQFEKYVLATEPSDCAFVAKFSKVVKIDLARTKLSVDSVTLHTLHAPHPLLNFAKEQLSHAILQEVQESPIVVFIHGLGGQMSQFEPLMGLLSQCVEIMAIDLPGFGHLKLEFKEGYKTETVLTAEEKDAISTSVASMAWSDFESNNIAAIITEYIRQNVPKNKKIILIGHSMGTHLLVKVAKQFEHTVEGMVLLSPPALFNDLEETQTPIKHPAMMKLFTLLPFLFNLFRTWDRLEGLGSKSVLRQLNAQSNVYQKVRQFRWNLDIDTRVLLRYVNGFAKTTYSELVTAIQNYNDNTKDLRTYEKTFLIGGLDDQMTPVRILGDIDSFLLEYWQKKVSHVTEVKNAGHSLLLAKPEFISGMVLNHFELNFPERLHLSPAWVLKLKADISGDKWGLKNELKWLQTQAVSFNITRRNSLDAAPLLGMKTLREGDLEHSPNVLEEAFYGSTKNNIKGKLIAIVDISADIPPYSPKLFQHIQYYKCATVSKVAPDHSAIRRFIQLIDDILGSTNEENPLVAVHCHYGFNRTGFLICCYLIERLGWSVQEAVEGFKAAKLPGIKHPHFVDALYVRYEH